ncbi:hypothetical protein F3F96_05805 [Mariprofundus sp. NF]|uniref:SPOR domain-containing protein n=1 Tax=Mariprofundus sp. NF TaxID=2608716 RepID=UPI00159FFEB3|nr:SPOR domain-containing protein [Mariprofundus sp. NF]NWF38643.1 hypothetical protein [Mariprofundus sp. NF]
MSDDKKLHHRELDPFAGEYEPEPFFDETPDETPVADEPLMQADETPTLEPENSVDPIDEEPLFPDESPEDFSETGETTTDTPIYSAPPEQKSGINIGMVAAVILVAVAAIGYLTIADNGEKPVQTAQVKEAQPAAVETAAVETAAVGTAAVGTAKVETAKVETAKVEAAKVEAAKVEATKVEAAKVETAKIETAKVEAAKVIMEKETSKNTAAPSATLPATDSGNWIIYLASVRSEKSAQQLVARIKASNIETKAVRANVKGKIFHRIQLHRTLNREDAEVTRSFLAKKLGLKGAWIEEKQL